MNAAIYHKYKLINSQRETTNPVTLERIRLEIIRQDRIISLWQPRWQTYAVTPLYVRASSFCNKDILGPKFFKTQLETLIWTNSSLPSALSVHKEVINKFFANYNKEKHQYADSYIYGTILTT